ncbi:unnamed protein product [Chironomus riparius]|uniref:Chitin-binding type-2 domain-containing protein n=1 Tax=Chironomus riparius TaxID=315576 RepID=A0A9N9SAE3_9DIPT|nr:unnamed protein product [Chironomus riparius]
MKLVTILILVQFWTQSFGLPADICVGSGYFDIRPHPDNCLQYIFCFWETPTIVDCEENHIFDAINKECMPGYPDICEFTSTASPTTTTQSTTTTTLSDTTTTTLSDTTTTTLSDTTTTTLSDTTTTTTLSDTTTTTTESGLANNFCHGINFGRFPHPINCFQFVVCVNEVAHIIDCTYPTEVFYSDSCVPGNSTTCEVFTNGTTTTTLSDTTTTTLSDTTTTTLSDTTTTTTLSDTTTTTLSDTTTTTTTTLSDTTTTTTTTTLSDTTTTTLSDTTTTTLSDTTTTTSEAGPEITTPLATTTTQRPNGPPELCIGNNLRFIPDPDYCFRFYYCLFGVALPGDCKPDNIFSEKWIGCVLGDWETCEPENPIFTLIPNHI